MQGLEKRVAALEQASVPETGRVRALFQQPGETDEQLAARAAADGWTGQNILVTFMKPKAKAEAALLSADGAVQSLR